MTTSHSIDPVLSDLLTQITALRYAVERLAPLPVITPDFTAADGFLWQASPPAFVPVPHINRLPVDCLIGIEHQIETLVENTWRYACGLPANNALLWGARGMGKSSLVKSAHKAVTERLNSERPQEWPLKLVEIHREDINSLPLLMSLVRAVPYRFIIWGWRRLG